MSEILATSPRLTGEAESVEGRLADLIEMDDDVKIGGYNVSTSDKAKIILALRQAAMQK